MEHRPKDLDIGNDVNISWLFFEGKIIGGIVTHPKPDAPNLDGVCSGSFYFRGNDYNLRYSRKTDEWDWNNNLEKPTLTPSFKCHCGFHGWVRDGKWVQA